METQKIPIKEASPDQLRKFAADYLGITIGGNSKPETILAKINAAWKKDHILVQVEAEAKPQEGSAPQPATPAQMPPKSDSEPMVRLIIPIQDVPGGSDPVPLGVNGKIMLVPRDEEVDIPERFYESLKNAVQNIYDPLPDGRGMNPTPRKVPLYPHTVLQPSKAA